MNTTTAHLPADGATPAGMGGLALRVSADRLDGAFSVHEGRLLPGEGVPLHVHDTADQLLYVIEGTVRVTVGDEVVEATAGDFVHKPKGVPHGFTNAGDVPATCLELTVSDQFERFVDAAAELADPSGLAELQRRFGMHFDVA